MVSVQAFPGRPHRQLVAPICFVPQQVRQLRLQCLDGASQLPQARVLGAQVGLWGLAGCGIRIFSNYAVGFGAHAKAKACKVPRARAHLHPLHHGAAGRVLATLGLRQSAPEACDLRVTLLDGRLGRMESRSALLYAVAQRLQGGR